jgi:hypothetical protein
VFRVGLGLLYFLSCRSVVERGSIAPAWFRTTTIIHQLSNSAMFSYLPHPWILTHDNLVFGCTGSPTMPQTVGTGTGTKMVITTEYLAMRLDRQIELLQDCLGVIDNSGDVLAKGDDTDNL